MTKKKTTDINPERNEKHQQWDKLRYIPKLILISACCGFVAFVALVVSILGMYSSNETRSDSKTDIAILKKETDLEFRYNEKHVKELTDEVEVWQIYSARLDAWLRSHGLEPPPLPEE